MDAGITHSRCPCWHDPGEILLIILWMSYFLYPQLARLPEARENRFSTEARAKFQQGNIEMYRERPRKPALSKAGKNGHSFQGGGEEASPFFRTVFSTG
jgi:hypothetical protein